MIDPKHLFIDTNVFLRIFRKTSDTINEVELLFELIEIGKIKLYTTDQISEEYFRNVERELEEALVEIRQVPDKVELPRLTQQFSHASEILKAFATIQSAKKALLAEAAEAIEGGQLKADSLISKIFGAATKFARSEDIIAKARLRRDLGNPPGKIDSLGDQINWEALLEGVPEKSALSLISKDGDYSLKGGSPKIKQYLKDEWAEKKGATITLYMDLKTYLAAEFPAFKDTKSVKKSVAIEALEKSGNFASTHKQISNLNAAYDGIDVGDALRIFRAIIVNPQVRWIANDADVREFYKKLFTRFYIDTPPDLDEALFEVAPYLDPLFVPVPPTDDEDDIPF